MSGEPMEVCQTGERYVYQVRSERHPKIRYRVDLVANGGAGRCACTDFSTRRQPAIDRNEPMHTRATRCKHLESAQRYFLREMLRELSRIEEGRQ